VKRLWLPQRHVSEKLGIDRRTLYRALERSDDEAAAEAATDDDEER